MNRRQFLKVSTGATAYFAMHRLAYAFYQSPGLQKFPANHALRGVYPLDPAGIPLATKDSHSTASVDHYSLVAGQYQDQLHPALGPTTLWGYADATLPLHRHLGGIIVATKGKPVQIT